MLLTPKMKAVKTGKWIITKKIPNFIDFAKGYTVKYSVVAGFSASHYVLTNLRVGWNYDTKTWLDCQVQFKLVASKINSLKTNFFRIADTITAETLTSNLAKSEDKIVSFLD